MKEKPGKDCKPQHDFKLYYETLEKGCRNFDAIPKRNLYANRSVREKQQRKLLQKRLISET